MQNLSFIAYTAEDKAACLQLFDRNCPAFFAPNERDDYAAFLDAAPPGYELCCEGQVVVGAFGLIRRDRPHGALNWILLSPELQGLGVGRAIMQRVMLLAQAQQISQISIAASHLSAPFFAKFGAKTVAVTTDGWGTNMHRVDMVLPL